MYLFLIHKINILCVSECVVPVLEDTADGSIETSWSFIEEIS